MLLTRKHLFRRYEGPLFHSDVNSHEEKVYGFYLLLRPILGWAKRSLLEKGLASSEAESELFILSELIYSNYDNTKSSLVPYLEHQIPWYVSKMLTKVEKYMCSSEAPVGLIDTGGTYEIDEEFYWKVPGILFEENYVGKCFTRGEKYVILTIIMSSNYRDLSTQGIAKRLGITRHTVRDKLEDIKEVMIQNNIQLEESNGRKF